MAEVSAVIFDMGRVLVDWNISEGLWALIRDALENPAEQNPKRRLWEGLYQRYATGQISPEVFHQRLSEHLGFRVAFEEFTRLWCQIFFPMEGMEKLFVEVERRLPVGLLSDTDPLHWSYLLKNYTFLGRIRNPVLSFQIGALKPAPECYLAAARNLGVSPEACLFVDDKPENVDGATRVGMSAVQFTGERELRGQLFARGVLTP